MMEKNSFKKFTVVNLLFTFSLAIVAVVLAPYLEKAGYLAWQISLMFTVFPLVNIIFMPLFGRWADLVNRRAIIGLGILLEILALVFYLVPGHWYMVVSARFFDAIAATLVSLIILAKIEDGIKSSSRGYSTGKFLSIGSIGALLGPLVGAWLADYFFVQVPFVVAIVILFFLLFWIHLGRHNSFHNLKIRISDLSWFKEIKMFWQHPQLKGVGILGMVSHAANPAMGIFIPLIIIDKFGLTYQAIGLVVFVRTFTHIFQIWFGKLGDKWQHSRMIILGLAISAITLISISFVESYWLLLLIMFIDGTGTSAWNVSAWSLMSNIGEKEGIEAQVLTSYFSIAKVGAFISFIVSALIVKWVGMETIFLMYGVVIFIGIIIARKFLIKTIKI